MEFRIKLDTKEIKASNNLISYDSKIGLIGSCFVENIGAKLEYYKFDNWINPFGILFSPSAIEKALLSISNKKVYTNDDLISSHEQWHSFDHHSKFSSSDFSEILSEINQNILIAYENIKNSSHIIITLGTAWVYEYKPTNELVANCHKIPQKEFDKKLLTVGEITKSLENSIQLIRKLNPNIEIIISLSPVRHLKDGMIQNSRSKAHLLNAIHDVVEKTQKSYYFPSYEIMIDELRNYRFYTNDMLHPNHDSVAYIWKLFTDVWFTKDSYTTMQEVASIQKGLQHKAFSPNSEAYLLFKNKLGEKQKMLFTKFGIRL